MPLFWHDRWRRGDAFGAGSDRVRNGFGKSELSPLGIPAVRDRVVQTAALPILEPVFQADFLDCSYGFRPGRSAQQALEEIRGHVQAGYRAVYDEDLRGYFDSIPHTELLACVDVRAVDRPVPVMERSGAGRRQYMEPGGKGKFQAVINRDKTRMVNLLEQGASPDFPQYTFRYGRDLIRTRSQILHRVSGERPR